MPNKAHDFFNNVAAAEAWTPQTQIAVLLDFVARQDYESFVEYVGERLETERMEMRADKRIIARFHPQAWQNDYAIDADPEGETEFDVTDAIVAMGKDKAMKIHDDRHESDHLQFSANAPQWIKEWSGPFYIEVADSIADYFEGET